MKPEFVDNRGPNTGAKALNDYLDELFAKLKTPAELSIASGYFNPEGFALLAARLERLPRVRLLLGAEPQPPPAQPEIVPGGPRGEALTKRSLQVALEAHAMGLRRDRDHLPFGPLASSPVHRLLSLLKTGNMEVRRYEKAFLHGKCYLFGTEEGVLAGSSNFTKAGLTTNLELNLGVYQPQIVGQVRAWFEDLWNEAVPYDLAALYEQRFLAHSPYLVYLRMLYELYKDDLGREAEVSELSLTAFQRDGVFRAQRILNEFGGVLVADEVGLGKTFLAGDIIRAALKERRQRVLVITPAALRDGPWKAFQLRYMLKDAEVVSFEQLQRDERLEADGDSIVLEHDPDKYALIVVDEAQSFRNPDALRARALRNLLRGSPRKQLLLLSATPVNNSIWDLYNLLTLFLDSDARLADKGIPSLSRRFERVAAVNPDDLRPDALFDVLDATTVRRTRHFVKRYYPNEKIKAHDGTTIHIRFPKPEVLPVNYDLEKVLPGLFAKLSQALIGRGGSPAKLSFARYDPDQFAKHRTSDPGAVAAIGLLRTGLLKRFESSTHAFRRTLERLILGCEAFLKGLSEGKVLRSASLRQIEDLSDTDEWDRLLEKGNWEPSSEFKVSLLKAAVEQDKDALVELLSDVKELDSPENPKLELLARELSAIAKQAAKEGHGDERDRRKVLIFTFFADTARSIHEFLVNRLNTDKSLAIYRGRMTAIFGEGSLDPGVSRDDAVFGFAPISTDAPSGRDDDRFDILVTTDVLAEGMNLQQCRHIINFDLPWNPMRLVQRHGRVDRIGSAHEKIYLRCYFPDEQLDALLNLEALLRGKIAQAAATIGLGSEVIPGSAVAEVTFAESREEIEALRKGKSNIFESGGERDGGHSSEEFRHEIRKALEDQVLAAQIKGLPGAAGAVLAKKGPAGFVFCARVGERVFLRYVGPGDSSVDRDVLASLRRSSCGSSSAKSSDASQLWEGAPDAWMRARKDIFGEWMELTDPARIQPAIRPIFRELAEHLRKFPPAGRTQEETNRALDTIEAPRPFRVERTFRDLRDSMREKPAGDLSLAILILIDQLGLSPFRPPEPRPPIEIGDIELVCWLRIIPGATS